MRVIHFPCNIYNRHNRMKSQSLNNLTGQKTSF